MDTENISLDIAVTEAESKIGPVVQEAEAVAAAITNDQGYNEALEYLKRNQAIKKMAVALLDPFRADAFKLYQATLDRIKAVIEPLDLKRALIEPRAAGYARERERQRQEEEAKMREAERQRIEAERKRQAEAAEIAGDINRAEEIKAAPVIVPPTVLPAAPRVKGVATTERWTAEVTDLMKLVKAVAAGKAPIACLKPDTQVLDSYARTQKGQMAIPGVIAKSVDGLRIGGR